ncbi:MAG: hypothetical protein ISN26_02245 [Betaproteobacteria bacterium AqS2]|uniref:Uncharacterized protein n=1 Tax=Candidatus Amphirhobacter heronislandensis TaxID=1732024 RepID=A0A930UGN3_9GAMM|nr:hypothetical protein [Betaproteobacteria bacterium AqS2]
MKTKSAKPQIIAAEVHAEAKDRANAFIRKLSKRPDGLFSLLWMRAFCSESSFIYGNSPVDRKDTEILIKVVFKKPQAPESVKKIFQSLIEWMEQAKHRCEIIPKNPSSDEITAHYELAFVQESIYSRKNSAKPRGNQSGASGIKWSGDCLAMTETKTAEICRGHPKNDYSILVFDHNSRFLEVSTASTLKLAQEKVKKKLG